MNIEILNGGIAAVKIAPVAAVYGRPQAEYLHCAIVWDDCHSCAKLWFALYSAPEFNNEGVMVKEARSVYQYDGEDIVVNGSAYEAWDNSNEFVFEHIALIKNFVIIND